MPIWCAIASTGSLNMREKLIHEGVDLDAPMQRPDVEVRVPADDDDDMVATKRDFCVAIFFIVFGVIAAVAGVGSNVYVQVNGVFFTPN